MAPESKRESEGSEEVCKRLKQDSTDVKPSESSDVEAKNNNNNESSFNSTSGKAEVQNNGTIPSENKKSSPDDSTAADKTKEEQRSENPDDKSDKSVNNDQKEPQATDSKSKQDEACTKEEQASNTNGKDKVESSEPKKPETGSTTDPEKKEDSIEEVNEGILLMCGGANWEMTGRKELPKTAKKPATPNPAARSLWGPHKVCHEGKPIRVKGIYSGCNACHSVIVTDDGDVMTFGRNDKGQLGLGDTEIRITPVCIELLRGLDIVAAACGRSHTLFLTSEGIVLACGDNKMGQCGTNQQAVQQITTPTRIAFKENKRVVKIACGAEFSMMVDEDGKLYSFGHPEHGQLGHNSEGKYFTTGNKYAFHCEYAPRRITTFIEKSREGHVTPLDDVKIVDIACGTNHTLAVDAKHRCFAWGFAGYHRLGHQETKNELVPRSIRTFEVPPSTGRGAARVFAGATHSMALDCNGLLYFWGQNKSSGEATMYPKNVQDLCGWRIRAVSCANRSIFVAAEDSCISWGPSPTYGELGYGEGKSKSSTIPSEVRTLDGVYAIDVACGFGHTMIMARDQKPEEKALIEKHFKDWP